MQIKNNKTTKQIKREFNAKFENLKIEFFLIQHDNMKGTQANQLIKENLHLSSIRKNQTEGEFVITPDMSTSSLENAFKENYGIYIQVYRKSGNIWLQTTSTDDWSLQRQNEIGSRNSGI